MDAEKLTKQMKEALESVIGPIGVEISDETTFTQQLGMDYLDLYEYEMELEDRLGIRFDEEPADETLTFGELKAVVGRKLKEAGR